MHVVSRKCPVDFILDQIQGEKMGGRGGGKSGDDWGVLGHGPLLANSETTYCPPRSLPPSLSLHQ